MGLTGYCREAEVVAVGMGAVVGEGGAYPCQVREDEVARRWGIYRHKGGGGGCICQVARRAGGRSGE